MRKHFFSDIHEQDFYSLVENLDNNFQEYILEVRQDTGFVEYLFKSKNKEKPYQINSMAISYLYQKITFWKYNNYENTFEMVRSYSSNSQKAEEFLENIPKDLSTMLYFYPNLIINRRNE